MSHDLSYEPAVSSRRRTGSFHFLVVVGAVVACALVAGAPAAAAEHRFGLGIHYWQTVDDLVGGAGLEDDGVSFIASYQYKPWRRGLIKFELDLEYFDDGFAGSGDSALAPIAYVVVGNTVYVAGGVGVTFSSGLANDPSDPFFSGRFGYDIKVLPGLSIDLNLNYRTNAFEELGDFDTDTFTIGAIARLKIK